MTSLRKKSPAPELARDAYLADLNAAWEQVQQGKAGLPLGPDEWTPRKYGAALGIGATGAGSRLRQMWQAGLATRERRRVPGYGVTPLWVYRVKGK
jgi:hypothetical protein